MDAATARTIQIGELAKLAGLSIDTIRFYEKQRLVRSPRRSLGGFRMFSESDVEILRFIRSAQELGFSLEEIRELLALRGDRAKACPKMVHILRAKLVSVKSKIATLREMESELRSALAKCDLSLSGSPARQSRPCPVLDQISRRGRRETRR